MKKNNIQWLPIIASVGVGAATYSMMTGQGGQLQNALPGIAKMTNQFQGQASRNQ
ncbi:hypothetical protein LCM20_04800 [Halobacillus litoralis]|uniref:hypothetical protein n=1 Tax=Halobacillus litoralis TaxID=45668 RepID=UPI001CD75BD8|nr:hypothetical protein [Halobacillus litoralis]MCA0969897.1 hypothetical protein [Halobacillus litoralis]